MRGFSGPFLNLLLDMSPKELFGAVVVALLVAVVTGQVVHRLRRPGRDAVAYAACPILLANVAVMALVAAYLEYRPQIVDGGDGPFNGIVFDGYSNRMLVPGQLPWPPPGPFPGRDDFRPYVQDEIDDAGAEHELPPGRFAPPEPPPHNTH